MTQSGSGNRRFPAAPQYNAGVQPVPTDELEGKQAEVPQGFVAVNEESEDEDILGGGYVAVAGPPPLEAEPRRSERLRDQPAVDYQAGIVREDVTRDEFKTLQEKCRNEVLKLVPLPMRDDMVEEFAFLSDKDVYFRGQYDEVWNVYMTPADTMRARVENPDEIEAWWTPVQRFYDLASGDNQFDPDKVLLKTIAVMQPHF